MELFFVGQFAAKPVGVGCGFRVADVNRPVQWKANFFEHADAHPDVSVAPPKSGMFDAGGFPPRPAFLGPKRTRFVTACLNETEKVAIGDVVTFNGERRHMNYARSALIVPAENFVVRLAKSESRFACGDFDEIGLEMKFTVGVSFLFGVDFVFVRQAMEQISESLRMHEAVFDGGLDHFQELGVPLAGVLQSQFNGGVDFFAEAGIVAIHFAPLGPIEGPIRGQAAANGIDSESEQLIEGRIERAKTKSAASEEVPIKSFDVAEIEDQTVAFGNRAFIKSFLVEERENLIGARTRVQQARLKVVTDADSGRSSHGMSPWFDAASTRRIRRKKDAGSRTTLRCSLSAAGVSIAK